MPTRDKSALLEAPPQTETVTDYDMRHTKTYLRLLDAESDGADWREVAAVVLGLDPGREPERARRIHDSHLAGARWMTRTGSRDLLRRAARH